MSTSILSISKTRFASSVCSEIDGDCYIYLSERFNRHKGSGGWPFAAFKILEQLIDGDYRWEYIGDNRDVDFTVDYEKALNSVYPLVEKLELQKKTAYLAWHNRSLIKLSHHLAHAWSCVGMSPFSRAVVLIVDGAGSCSNDNKRLDFHDFMDLPFEKSYEEYSIYLFNDGELIPVKKKWQTFQVLDKQKKIFASSSIGIFYEVIAQYIFNDKRAAGKVMGLAAFGNPLTVGNRTCFLQGLNWDKSFKGSDKKEWESSPNMQLWMDLAATAQQEYENYISKITNWIVKKFADYSNLILGGGSALNCVNNMKIVNSNKFQNVYIPPFPGDEGISYGISQFIKFNIIQQRWHPVAYEKQHAFWGADYHEYSAEEIGKIFEGFNVIEINNIDIIASALIEGKVLGWFQGRSEVGPRALGHRSIIATVDRNNLKEYLNNNIKFREEFRPYACSCLYEKASIYFDIHNGFENPYMSFSVKVRQAYREIFKEVAHIDGTSRMQTVRHCCNEEYYDLIREIGDRTGIYAVLNTSLNVMGEPICETIYDLKKILLNSNLDGVVYKNYYIKNNCQLNPPCT